MINILIRSHRPKEFQGCINSITEQLYTDVNLIVAVDNPDNMEPVSRTLEDAGVPHQVIEVKNQGRPYSWNLYCNDLKGQVRQGWFFYLDDDDALDSKFALQGIRPHLSENYGTVCQFLRNRKPKPRYRTSFQMQPDDIVLGKIGGSCIFLHHSHKDVAHWDDQVAADYRFIRDVRKQIPLKFVPVVVVKALNNGRHGK